MLLERDFPISIDIRPGQVVLYDVYLKCQDVVFVRVHSLQELASFSSSSSTTTSRPGVDVERTYGCLKSDTKEAKCPMNCSVQGHKIRLVVNVLGTKADTRKALSESGPNLRHLVILQWVNIYRTVIKDSDRPVLCFPNGQSRRE